MKGEKTLHEIKEELWKAFAADGRDPIQALDAEIQRLKKQRKQKQNGTEVLEAIRRVLQDHEHTTSDRARSTRRVGRRTGATKTNKPSRT